MAKETIDDSKPVLEGHAHVRVERSDEEKVLLKHFGYHPGQRYLVMKDQASRGLTELVNSLMEFGWTPQGGVCVGTKDDRAFFAQALVRESPEPSE